MSNLKEQKCVPCEGGLPAMPEEDEDEYIKKISEWELDRSGIHKIKRTFEFKNFKEAMKFVNKVAEIAEEDGHHPDIYIYYNKVELELYTHAVQGLFKNDFIVAAKINEI